MKKKLLSLYRSFVKDVDDLKLFVAAMACLAAALGLAVYDTVTIVRGTVDPNVHLPFLLVLALGAFGGIILAILRHGATCARCRDGSHGPPPGSYQHRDHWPRGRIDPPDGTSD